MCAYAHGVIGHKLCGLHDLHSSPCQPLSCSVQQMRDDREPVHWNLVKSRIRAVSAHAPYQRTGVGSRKWCELRLSLWHAGIVYYRKLSKEWSCSIWVTSQSPSQPSPAAHAPPLFIKYHSGPVYGRGGCRSSSLLSVPVYSYLKCQGIM